MRKWSSSNSMETNERFDGGGDAAAAAAAAAGSLTI